MSTLQSLIVEIRVLRKEIGVEEKAFTPIELRLDSKPCKQSLENQVTIRAIGESERSAISSTRFLPA